LKLNVLILGYGEMGHAMEFLLADKHNITIWTRSGIVNIEEQVFRSDLILFCIPVNAHPQICQRILPFLSTNTLCLTIAKGLDENGMTAAQVLNTILTTRFPYGVIYGPMISEEIRSGRFSFANVSLSEVKNFITVQDLFQRTRLICYHSNDMAGMCWSAVLKNVYAILFGISDELKLGDNIRGYLMVVALAELSQITTILGGCASTPYEYSGLGDLTTTATSPNSHHYQLGCKLASGQYSELSGEGIHTLSMVAKYQLIDSQNFPLFSLVNSIVNKPENLLGFIDEYFEKLY